MCIICISISQDQLRSYEAELALRELSSTLDPDHIEEVVELIHELAQEEEG